MQFILVTHAVIRSCSQGLESLLKMGQRGKWTWCSQHLCSLATQNLSCLTKIKLPGSTTGGKSRLSPRAPTFHPAFPSEFRQSVVLLHWQAFYPETNNPKVVTKLLPTWGLIWTPISNCKFLYLSGNPSLWLFQVHSFQNHTEVAHEAAHGFGRLPLLSFTSKTKKTTIYGRGSWDTDTQYIFFFTMTVIIKMNNHNGGFLLHNLLPSLQTSKKPWVILYMQ